VRCEVRVVACRELKSLFRRGSRLSIFGQCEPLTRCLSDEFLLQRYATSDDHRKH
jgi:hypothetical protein